MESLENRLALSTLAGTVFTDLNGNGARDSGETGIGGVTVYLDQNQNAVPDTGDLVTQTANDGSYSFGGLSSGTYRVVQAVPAAYLQTVPAPATPISNPGMPDAAIVPPAAHPTGITLVGGVMYVADSDSSSIWKLDPTTGQPLPGSNPFTLSNGAHVNYLTHDGAYFWGLDTTNDRLVRFDGNGQVQGTPLSTPGASPYGLTWDGDSLLVGDQGTNRIYDVDPTTGVVNRSFPAPGATLWGLEHDGQNLWVSSEEAGGAFLYRVNPADGAVLGSKIATNPRERSIDMAFDGQRMWEAQIYAGRLVRMSISQPAAQSVTLNADVANVDFGDFQGAAAGTVINAATGLGLAGWRVYLDDGNGTYDGWEPQAITDASGAYAFNNLAPNRNYQVAVEARQPGWSPTTVTAITVSPVTSGMAATANFGQQLNGVGPIGGETLVNTTVSGAQNEGTVPVGARNIVAIDQSGNYAVVWSGNGTGDADGVFVRLFNADASPRTGEIRVNVTTTGSQISPVIAMTPTGQFAVAWNTPGGVGSNVVARVFNADGTAKTGEVTVFTGRSNTFATSSIATDSNGNFVVVAGEMEKKGTLTQNYYIDAQRLNSSAQLQGSPIRFARTWLNTAGSVAMDRQGNFVLVWDQYANGVLSVRAQRYDKTGKALGSQITVASTDAAFSSVAMDSNGIFVVAWGKPSPTGNDQRGARVFNSSGSAISPVLTYGGNIQEVSGVSIDDSGTILLTWSQDQGYMDYDVWGQRFTAATTAWSPLDAAPFRINTTLNLTNYGKNSLSYATALRGGRFAASWIGYGTADDAGVYSQLYSTAASLPAAAPQAASSPLLRTSSTSGGPSHGAHHANERTASPRGTSAVVLPANQAADAALSELLGIRSKSNKTSSASLADPFDDLAWLDRS